MRETDCIVDENLDEQNDYQVKYNLSYDNDSNIVTIKVEAQNERGDIDVDEMQGTTFVNEKGEIDAIMNINGKTVLLSELLKDDIINRFVLCASRFLFCEKFDLVKIVFAVCLYY